MSKIRAESEHSWPTIPGYTCPEIDSVILQLEELREANQTLRGSFEAMVEVAEELLSTLRVERKELDEVRKQRDSWMADAQAYEATIQRMEADNG